MELIIRIILLISSAISFALGAVFFFKKKTALFKILIAAAIGCFMLGRLYELVTVLIKGSIPGIFNVGMLGMLGGFLFIFSASYSQMDGLVDDKSKTLSKYRTIAYTAPLIILIIAALCLKADISVSLKVFLMFIFFVIAQSSYYNLKHVIIPDVSFGIIASIRQYSICALILELFYALQLMADKLEITGLWMISSIAIIPLYPALLIAMDRGSKKWTL